jgi:hypothetical protein
VEQCIESEAEESESEEDETPVVSKTRHTNTENLEQDQVKKKFPRIKETFKRKCREKRT